MSTKTLNDTISEAMAAAQAILAFNGFEDEVISEISLSSQKDLASGEKSVGIKKKRCCATWDCVNTNGGRCICIKWKDC